MKLTAVLVIVASVAATAAGHAHHHHHRHHHAKAPACTIESESQCNGQNWTMSTCCKDPSYECRRDDFGQNVMRCQKKKHLRKAHKMYESDDAESVDDSTEAESSNDSITLLYVAPSHKHHQKRHHEQKAAMGFNCESDSDCGTGTVCVPYSNMGQLCVPTSLPQGALCGQNSPKFWRYNACGEGLYCKQGGGNDLRCSKST